MCVLIACSQVSPSVQELVEHLASPSLPQNVKITRSLQSVVEIGGAGGEELENLELGAQEEDLSDSEDEEGP